MVRLFQSTCLGISSSRSLVDTSFRSNGGHRDISFVASTSGSYCQQGVVFRVSFKCQPLTRRRVRRSRFWRGERTLALPSTVLDSFGGNRGQVKGIRALSRVRSYDRQNSGRLDGKSSANPVGPKETGEFPRQAHYRRSKSGSLLRSSRCPLSSLDWRGSSQAPQCSQVWKSCQRSFVTAAAFASLSFSLCSTAFANPISSDIGTIPLISHDDIQVQLTHGLEAEINAQRAWLESIGQPLSQWTIDDRIMQKLNANVVDGGAGAKVDESGKTVKIQSIDNVVIPLLQPSEVVKMKEAVTPPEIIKVDKVGSRRLSDESVPAVSSASIQSTTIHLSTSDSSELVAVTALPLGSVVSSAAGSLASMGGSTVVQAMSVPARGLGLMTRIMIHFSGGGLAGAMGATLVYPLDTVKTRMQAQKSKDGEEPHYKDEVHCLKQVISEEGVGALYSGLVPQLIGIAPEKAMKLTVNELLLELLESEMPGVGVVLLELIAGGGGGLSQVVFTNPMEAVKVRLQTQPKDSKPKNTWEVVKELGVQGLYNGSTVTLARDVPSTAIFFAVYTFIRQMYPEQSFVAGCLAAIPSTVLVTPMDVVKTRMQMERADGDQPYANPWECFLEILRNEGVGALFKGSTARVLKSSPQFGITLMLYNMLCE